MTVTADPAMCALAARRGPVWVQIDQPAVHEVVATLVCWRDRNALVEFATGRRRRIDNSRIRPA